LRKVAEMYEGTLIALVTALDAREHDTGLHSLRVKEYAIKLAAGLALDFKQINIIGKGLLLHDIGKIGTPDNILLEKGSLSKEERYIIQQHVETGRRILNSVPFFKDAASIVYSHHERYDGSGYPNGLKGEQIPLGARIFAVVDVLDALTSNRPYHKKITCKEAVEIITNDSGKHFDPNVIDAFLRTPCDEWDRISMNLSERSTMLKEINLE
jgi:putative nucleotidyltransferase with HDIG domain